MEEIIIVMELMSGFRNGNKKITDIIFVLHFK